MTAEAVVAACRAHHPERVVVSVGDVQFVVSAAPCVMSACEGFRAFGSVRPAGTADLRLPIVHVAAGDSVRKRLPPLRAFDPLPGGRPETDQELVVPLAGDCPAVYAATADRREAAVWYSDVERRAWWERARPLLPVVQSFLRDSPWRVLHAAAVGANNSATLLTGGSHAGKTTLALTALMHGAQYFGDDVVAVAPHGPHDTAPRVARVYATARLRLPPLPNLAPLVAEGVGSSEMGETRSELHLGRRLAHTPLTATLSRLVHVERNGGAQPQFTRVGRGRVLATVTATTLQVGFGDLGHHTTIAELCSVLPPVGFDPGADPVAAVRALLKDES
ncbi:MAG TPA: hypothetical protein DCR14_00875 [Acidimicrobiaceae bacterium]|nr:hypothetical protein [Acidimicrobiaceae bacterium]